MRQEAERRMGELALGFFRRKLGHSPQRVEIRLERNLLVVRIRGFLTWAEPVAGESPGDRPAVEQYYLRLFDEIARLLRAGVRGAAGRAVLEVQTLPNLAEDECLFLLTLRHEKTEGVYMTNRAGGATPE